MASKRRRRNGTCRDCNAPIVLTGNKSGKCAPCAAKTRAPGKPRPPKRNCISCGKGISDKGKTGRCTSCATAYWNTLPETREKRREGWKKRLARPGEYEKLCKVAARNSQKAMADPEKRAKAAERARNVMRQYLSDPEVIAKWRAGRKRAGEKIREYRLGWCPEKYRALHYENVNRHHIKAEESRAMIEKLVAEDEALKWVDSALDYLRRLAPVAKLENGYRYGNSILTPAQVVDRAKLRGWQPERWAA